jgi:hypothetical protein
MTLPLKLPFSQVEDDTRLKEHYTMLAFECHRTDDTDILTRLKELLDVVGKHGYD